MKTLVYTSIYSNLWGTDFGGRPGRGLHYKYSLLNLLNLNADKFICFTDKEELTSLRDWFYVQNKVSEEKLEFIIFNLIDSKYFQDIARLKNLDEIKTSDRCYEVQYNKFFWIDNIPNIESYDRVYWFDAGLSHSGIFPQQYSFGKGHEKNFNFSLFNKNFLNYINDLTEDRFLLVSKNNTGAYYWSTTLPRKFYNQYSNAEHIIGGFFGGTLEKFKQVQAGFESLLTTLFQEEQELYFEELLISCMYQNNKQNYVTLSFDDWYDRERPEVYGTSTSYFYNIFELNKTKVCVTTICIELDKSTNRYLKCGKRLIETHLKYTDFNILIITNDTSYFSDITDSRVLIVDYESSFTEPTVSGSRFNMHLKRLPVKLAKELGYDIIFLNDVDCFITGWDNASFQNKCKEDFDVAFVSHANPQLGGLRQTYKHFQDKIDLEFGDLYYDELDKAPNPAETRVIFKNNEKLTNYLKFWDKIAARNNDYFTYHDGVYFGTSGVYAEMKMIGVTPQNEFTSFCRIAHANEVLDYFGHRVEDFTFEQEAVIEGSQVRGSFTYKGLPALQHPAIREVFRELLKVKKPRRIIEIGTEYGGLTLMLQDLLIELDLVETIIRTYDIKDPKFLLKHEGRTSIIEIVKKDLFEYSPFRLKEESVKELEEFIGIEGTTLILCDGGNKIEEFKVMSDLIREGDIIMAHDYAKDEKTFKEEIYGKIWNWFEIQESDIRSAIERNNLKPYMEADFEEVVWICKIKQV